MTTTRTGSFPIGFRRLGSDWQKDLQATIRFAKEQQFAGFDVPALPADELKLISGAQLRIGSVDLQQPWGDLASSDAAERKDAAQRQGQHVKDAVKQGARNFFVVVLPKDPALPRRENFKHAVDGYGQLCSAIGNTEAKIVVEGWPGGLPHYASLACTPADYRAFFKDVGSDVLGVNFDPSHLIRMGIDPLRFLGEFADRVHHVHGKDTELLDDELYEHGNLQQATFAKGHGWGGHHWRYTIPGHGVARWSRLLSMLKDAGYQGMVCIELEDERFNGSEDGEKRGLIASRDFLSTV